MLMDSFLFLVTVANAIGFFTLLSILLFKVYERFHQENKDLDSSSSSSPSASSSLSASSRPSSSSCKWTHDVFPSFRGEDVRRNFLSHIQKEFCRKGITLFIDNDIKRGESIGPELIQAIKRSKVAVVLLSRNYASSKWCLDELVEIMKCKEKSGQRVFAIFYEVDPSEVKKLNGDFGAVFKKTCAGKTKEDIGRWRQALEKVATTAGYDSRNWDNEALMIEDIVTEISRRLISSTPSRYLEGLIGMGAHTDEMKRLLCLGSDEVRMVGIWGLPGIGKTTIARVLHSQISDAFQLSAFITFKPSYASQPCSDDYDERLQLEQRFLSELLNQKDLVIPHLGVARNFLTGKKVLLIFDGVEQLEQLDVMSEPQCLGLGSRVIITTQNLRLLKAFKIQNIYEVSLPHEDEALQIFCMNAFGQSSPKDGFEDLSRKITRLVGRLPLGLKVIGSHFREILSEQEWKAELSRLRVVCLDKKIGSILKFSYDALEEEDKKLFLYIACFFAQHHIDHDTFDHVLKHNFSNADQGKQVLVQRSLLAINYFQGSYRGDQISHTMHNLLVQLGKEIVRRNQFSQDPGKRQFLLDTKEICEVLSENTGSKSVIGIDLNISEIEGSLCLDENAFEEMSNLQILRFYTNGNGGLQFPQGLKYLSPKLRILYWDYYPVESLPSTFNPKFLVKIELKYSNLERLWEGVKLLGNLKKMDLSYSKTLKELPDLSLATNLRYLLLNGCSKLEILPININLGSLVELDVTGCSQLRSFPEISTNIEQLYLCGTLIEEVPLSVKSWSQLKYLEIPYCKNLGEFPNLLNSIIVLELNNTEIEEFPPWFSGMSGLRRLVLNNCRKLVSLPQLPSSLWSLKAENCESLERLAGSFPNSIDSLKFINCWKLNEETREKIIIIRSSWINSNMLPGREVPELFTYRSTTGGSIKANLGGNSKRFQACISLVCKADKRACDDEEGARVTCNIVDKLRGDFLSPLSTEHLYTFRVEANYVKSGELFIEFELKSDKWEIAQCGIRQL